MNLVSAAKPCGSTDDRLVQLQWLGKMAPVLHCRCTRLGKTGACDWATDPRGRRIGPVFALRGLCDAPFSTMDLEYFHGQSRHEGWPRSFRADTRRSARPRPPRLGTALYLRWEFCSPSLTVEDAAFDFEIQHGDTRETAISFAQSARRETGARGQPERRQQSVPPPHENRKAGTASLVPISSKAIA